MGGPLSLLVKVEEVLSRASTAEVLATARNPALWRLMSWCPAAARACTKAL